jgi:PAS domain S-box-containing protein
MASKLADKMGELGSLNRRMARLVEVGLNVTLERDPERLLQMVCDEAREIIGARYSAIGLLAADGRTLSHFLTSGMEPETVAQIGELPSGKGVLGKLLEEGRPLRIADISADPDSAGFPPGHPAMRSFLGAPILTPVTNYGRLYLTEKIGGQEFSEEDEQLAVALAAQVAVTYENARLYDDIQQHATKLQLEIIERKKVEQALACSERRFRSLIENSTDAIALIDPRGQILYASASNQKMLGYEAPDMTGKNAFDLVHPDDREELVTAIGALVRAEQAAITKTFLFRHKDGSWRWVEGTAHSMLEEPSVAGIVVNYHDVSERKQAEQEIESLANLSRENTGTVLRIGRDGRLLYANAASRPLLREWGSEAGGEPPEEIWLAASEVLVSGENHEIEVTYGDRTDALMFVPVPEKEYVNVYGRDITERKRTEGLLAEKEGLLSEAQRVGHIGSWSYDLHLDRLQFSDEMYRLLNVRPEEFPHTIESLLELVYSVDRPVVAAWFEEIKAGDQARELDFRVFQKQGELCDLHFSGAMLFDANRKAERFTCTAQDITERKLMQIQIEQQLIYLTALREIDQVILTGFDLNVTLNYLLSQVIAQLHVDAADILLLDSDSQILHCAAAQGFHTHAAQAMSVNVGTSHAGHAVKERRLIQVFDVRENSGDPVRADILAQEGFVTYLAAPLHNRGTVRGVLEVFQREPFQPYPEWQNFLNSLAVQTAIAVENASLFRNLQSTHQELLHSYDATIEGWSRAMDLRDKETEGHTQRVTRLTLDLARAMGIDESQLVHIRRGALLHDIGKLGVPDAILHKPDRLTPDEWEIMRKHPQFAYDMLAPIPYLKNALAIPFCHHEKWDGTGYPLGLQGEKIPLEARIFAVVDVWDAVTSDRPYRAAWSVEQALTYIREQSGRHFDPLVVDSFFQVIEGTVLHPAR